MEYQKSVDFNKLKNFNKLVEEHMLNLQDHGYDSDWSQLENFRLFMEMMSKSSSFAHKAHKELRGKKVYHYRSLSIIGCEYYISGVDKGIDGVGVASGILEWCKDEQDAKNRLDIMMQFPQFENITIVKSGHELEVSDKYDDKYWHWNNGKFRYCHPNYDTSIEIRLFDSRVSEISLGVLIIDGEIKLQGFTLDLINEDNYRNEFPIVARKYLYELEK